MAAEKKLTRAYLSPAENVGLGIFGGMAETTIFMPILTWKFCIQEGRPLPRNLTGLYRGMFAQVSSVAPITGLQVVANGILAQLMSGGTRDLSKPEKLLTAIGAGGLSAIVYSPADLTTIHQQKLGLNIPATIKHLHGQYGLPGLFRGFGSTAGREAIYTCGYLGIVPVVAETLREQEICSSELTSNLGGAVAGGCLASLLSHPLDTCKTVVQADMAGTTYPNARATFGMLVREQGIAALYRGGLPRLARNIGAFFLIAVLREKFIDYKTLQMGL